MSKPVSKTTVSTYIRHLKVFLTWCSTIYPNDKFDYKVIKVPKVPKKHVDIYSDFHIREMFTSIDSSIPWLVSRNCSIIALMLDSGLRQAEITRVLYKDINYTRKLINIHGKGDKDRLVPLGNISLSYIKDYITLCPYDFKNSDFLFFTLNLDSITTNTVKLMVSKLSKKLSFEFSSHKLRHNFATNYCLNQYEKYGHIDIYQLMYLMGHNDVKVTSRYVHFAYEIIAVKNSISHIDNVFGNVVI